MHRHPIAAPVTAAVRRGLPLLLAAAVAVTLAACDPVPPAERVADLRNDYEAELNSFNVIETPMVEESGMEVGDETAMGEEPMDDAAAEGAVSEGGADAAAAADGDAPADGGVVEEMPMRQDVMLDVVLRKVSGDERLPGLTLDVYQVDAQQTDKANFRIWVDTSGLAKGSRRAVSYVLEDVDFTEGDAFAVEVRPNVPEPVREQYREFAEADTGEGEGG
jgi:hypothetical protein